MNLKEIREIIKLMNENELTEVEVEREGGKIKLKKASSGEMVQQVVSPRVLPSVPVTSQPSAPAESVVPASSNELTIASPMVGTFYRAASPDTPPYVEVGQTIEVGQVVCIVEAMKLMNEIKSEVKGKIVSAPVENANPVEFGQALFIVEPV